MSLPPSDPVSTSTELDSVHHSALVVEDIDRAVRWHAQRFDCEVRYQDPTWALLEFANTRLALVVPGGHPPHIAISREDAESFGPLTPHRDGTRSVYVKDPWGNSIEILDASSDSC